MSWLGKTVAGQLDNVVADTAGRVADDIVRESVEKSVKESIQAVIGQVDEIVDAAVRTSVRESVDETLERTVKAVASDLIATGTVKGVTQEVLEGSIKGYGKTVADQTLESSLREVVSEGTEGITKTTTKKSALRNIKRAFTKTMNTLWNNKTVVLAGAAAVGAYVYLSERHSDKVDPSYRINKIERIKKLGMFGTTRVNIFFQHPDPGESVPNLELNMEHIRIGVLGEQHQLENDDKGANHQPVLTNTSPSIDGEQYAIKQITPGHLEVDLGINLSKDYDYTGVPLLQRPTMRIVSDGLDTMLNALGETAGGVATWFGGAVGEALNGMGLDISETVDQVIVVVMIIVAVIVLALVIRFFVRGFTGLGSATTASKKSKSAPDEQGSSAPNTAT